MKHAFQTVLPKARRIVGSGNKFLIKNLQSGQVESHLKSAGWKVEGRHDYNNGTTYGMTNGKEHVVFSDSGKYPYFLGDTEIQIGQITTFDDHMTRQCESAFTNRLA
jgi:hypothetical protein